MKLPCFFSLLFSLLTVDTRGQTNEVFKPLFETKYWMPEAQKLTNASVLFENDFLTEIEAFKKTKSKYKPLVKKWAAIYLKRIKCTEPRTLYVGPFTEKTLPVYIYDYEGEAFWEVGSIKSFEDPYALSPALVTKIYTFDFLLAGTYDADAKAGQTFLIKWQVANCVMDGMRIDISAEDIVNAQLVPSSTNCDVKQPNSTLEDANITSGLSTALCGRAQETGQVQAVTAAPNNQSKQKPVGSDSLLNHRHENHETPGGTSSAVE